jgi:hypothetical protein
MRPGIEHEARSIKHVPPAKTRVAPRLAIKVTLTLSRLHPRFDSLARLDAWHQQPSLFLLPFQALPSFLSICVAVAHGSVTRCLLLEVLVSRITRSAPTLRFPNHPPLFCVPRKGRGRFGLSVILCHLSDSCANNHKNLIPDWKL